MFKSPQSPSVRPKQRVILVGVGGATCSGKTTLAKRLAGIVPNSFIIHQDDFTPPEDVVYLHPTLQVPDWDAPRGAVNWPRLVSFVKGVKETGRIPEEHLGLDYLNASKEVPVGEAAGRWRGVFEEAAAKLKQEEEEVVWVFVEGFLIYWHPDVVAQLDVRLLLRVPHDVIKQRRQDRPRQYATDDTFWDDPPGYWESIAYPAYVQYSGGLFERGDVEHGAVAMPSPDSASKSSVQGEWEGEGETGTASAVADLLLIDLLEMKMDGVVERVCEVLIKEVNGDK